MALTRRSGFESSFFLSESKVGITLEAKRLTARLDSNACARNQAETGRCLLMHLHMHKNNILRSTMTTTTTVTTVTTVTMMTTMTTTTFLRLPHLWRWHTYQPTNSRQLINIFICTFLRRRRRRRRRLRCHKWPQLIWNHYSSLNLVWAIKVGYVVEH